MATPRSTLGLSAAATLIIGALLGALGPLLPSLSVRLSERVETLGTLFSAQFAGALVAQFVGGWLNERLGLRNMVAIGVSLLTLGILGISFSPVLSLVLACTFLAGLGQGALDISTNVLVAAVYESHAAVSALNLLHVTFGVGAVITPLLTALAIDRWGTPMPVLWLTAVGGVACLAGTRRWVMDARADRASAAGEVREGLYGRPELWLIGAMLFVYVGGEIGVGGWSTVYMGRTTSLPGDSIALVVSSYWMALTVGRLVGAALGTRMGAVSLSLISIVGACLGAAMMLAGSGGVALTVAGTILMGFSFGPIFPTGVVLGTERFPDSPSRAMSVIISLSSIGGIVLPALQGVVLERISPFASIVQVVLIVTAMLALLLVIQRRGRAAVVVPAAERK